MQWLMGILARQEALLHFEEVRTEESLVDSYNYCIDKRVQTRLDSLAAYYSTKCKKIEPIFYCFKHGSVLHATVL